MGYNRIYDMFFRQPRGVISYTIRLVAKLKYDFIIEYFRKFHETDTGVGSRIMDENMYKPAKLEREKRRIQAE